MDPSTALIQILMLIGAFWVFMLMVGLGRIWSHTARTAYDTRKILLLLQEQAPKESGE